MSSYARANLRITNEKQKENSHEGITWSEMGKQNVQAEKIYSHPRLGKHELACGAYWRYITNDVGSNCENSFGSNIAGFHLASAAVIVSVFRISILHIDLFPLLFSVNENWKTLADHLGLTNTQISFFDGRYKNPADEVLKFWEVKAASTVGILYDILVELKFAYIADCL